MIVRIQNWVKQVLVWREMLNEWQRAAATQGTLPGIDEDYIRIRKLQTS